MVVAVVVSLSPPWTVLSPFSSSFRVQARRHVSPVESSEMRCVGRGNQAILANKAGGSVCWVGTEVKTVYDTVNLGHTFIYSFESPHEVNRISKVSERGERHVPSPL